MRALLLTTSFPRAPTDFAGRFVLGYAEMLRAAGYRVRVCAPRSRDIQRGWPSGITRIDWPAAPGLFGGVGAPEALARRPLRAGLAAGVSTGQLCATAGLRVASGERVIGHWLVPSGLAALVAGRRWGGPVHLIAHGSDVALLERMPLGRAIARRLDAGARTITCVSGDLRDRLRALIGRPPRSRWVICPMGVEPARPCPQAVAALRRRAAGHRVVATIGRMVPLKGLDVLAEALAGRDDVVWFAAGDGPSAAELTAQCARLGVPLRRLGVLDPPRRDALLAVADVFALPSRPVGRRSEGTPVALLEALASGVPAVASAIGGVPALADEAGLFTVPPDDPQALRRALDVVLDEVLTDPQRAAALRAAHRRAGAARSWARLAPMHLSTLVD